MQKIIKRRSFKSHALIILSFTTIFLFLYCYTCAERKVNYVKILDSIDIGPDPWQNVSLLESTDVYSYNESQPIIFVGGVPRSGTTLMRVLLDVHPLVHCGEETTILPLLLDMRRRLNAHKAEYNSLNLAGVTPDVLDSAVRLFMLEVIVKHSRGAPHLCNKDPFILKDSNYVSHLFPQAKFILMIRDGRATVHSMMTRKVMVSGFNLKSYRDSLREWSFLIKHMYTDCFRLGAKKCLPVQYEKLVLNPEIEMRKILEFLNLPWNEAVLHHENYIGNEVPLSKIERSSDQVMKPINLEALSSWVGKIPADVVAEMDSIAPMLRQLGYDPNANPPNYGEADARVKENTFQIQANRGYWINLAREYGIYMIDEENENKDL